MFRSLVLAAAVFLGLCAPARAQALVHSGDRIVPFGNSISDSRVWVNPAGGLLAQLDTGLKHIGGTAGNGFIAGSQGSSFIAGKVTGYAFFNAGVNGNQTSDMLARVQGVIALNPNVLIVEGGVNDINGGAGAATAIANMTSIVQAVQAALPNCKIVVTGIVVFGEAWVTGPPAAWGPGNGPADTVDAGYQSLCATLGCTYVPFRPAVLQWEAANNPTQANTGVFTDDGIHPKNPGWLGAPTPAPTVVLGTIARPFFTVVP